MERTLTSKVCLGCNQNLPLEAFPNEARGYLGKNRRCKTCKWAYEKTYREGRKDQYNAQQRRWRENNKERYNEIQTQWRKDNPERNREIHNASWHKYRSGLEGDDITIGELYKRDKGVCSLCDLSCTLEEAEIEHSIPLCRGGSHTWDNVMLAHGLCNRRKGSKTLEEWNNQRRHHQ